jgi:hypothetical protein
MPPVPPPPSPTATVKQRIVEYLKLTPFERAIEQADFQALLAEDAATTAPLYTPEAIAAFKEARELRHARRSTPAPAAFFNNKSVLLVPGFLGSQLRDDGPAGNGLIWIDPRLYFDSSKLSALRLAKYNADDPDTDADTRVAVHEDGAVPILYAGLRYYLESGRCEVRTAGFDWRKNIDESAALLAETIRSFANEHPGRPFFLIAHSQGSLVARRALQLLGKETARRTVNRLILLGPASYGTFSAAFAIAGNHEMIQTLAKYGLHWPDDLSDVLQSMTGLYQLLPWKAGTVQMDPAKLAAPGFWETGRDAKRLAAFFRWGASLDTQFFNDRTTIILGDNPNTPSAVEFQDGKLVATIMSHGDGTVPDGCALIEGVGDIARATGADHMTLPLNRQVMQTVWRIINANLTVQAVSAPARGRARRKEEPHAIPVLPQAVDLFALAGVRRPSARPQARRPAQQPAAAPTHPQHLLSRYSAAPPAPPYRRLRVFSFDPLLATDPGSMGMESVVVKLDWDDESADGAKLQPGPVGEYLEVVDYDPASRCFYPPVDLNHPNLLAQDGMPLSETDPRFHQQMVYAVAMATIAVFERALGRTVLWSPFLPRSADGAVDRVAIRTRADGEFVRRLRIYPHAMREPNAYYDPNRKSVLFGYFPARSKPGDKVLPHGTVFTCLSYDVIAHEITHALLDGTHRHLLDASNPDILAFHEAFADIVALFQHFSHPEVLRGQIAQVAGNLQDEGMLGQLAQQFGEAMGMHRSLRNYLGEWVEQPNGELKWEPIKPNPTLIQTVQEPHDRGAILVAAMFTAFLTIYRGRTRDLMRIATGGSGVKPPGDLHPDLVGRLADEAANAAHHLLVMAIRALDYIPPVDLSYGDYLRGLVTSDLDLVAEDGRFSLVAVVDAFRQWGIYPRDVRNLSIDSLVWNPPEDASLKLDMQLFRDFAAIGNGNLKVDRADLYQHQRNFQQKLHDWMRELFVENPALGAEWGLDVSPDAPQTIRRDNRPDLPVKHLPVFDVHSVRRCRRIAPNGQERIDVLVEVIQRRDGYFDPADQQKANQGQPPADGPDFIFRGGATLIVNPRAGRIRYAIRKSISNEDRFEENRAFQSGSGTALGLRGNYFRDTTGNPFALLHATED